jgi:formate dehydrogenase iron-sulfur subunit
MSKGKSIMVDTSRCSACRGCQVACKQWNGLPGTKTKQIGTYQNPQDVSAETWKLVRFAEGVKDSGKPYWYFFSEQCRHCVEPPCLGMADNPAAIFKDEATGAVIYTAKTKGLKAKEITESCPYNIPRKGKDGALAKCTMCIDRITNNKIPACVQSCPTGAMAFGDRDFIMDKVKKRVEDLKKTYPKAVALNPEDVRVIYIVTDDPKKYHKYAAA